MGTGVPATHRGHGFAIGHPQFALPSQHKPADGGRLARSLTPELLLPGKSGCRHGSAELGSTARERERDRACGQRSTQAPAAVLAGPVVGDATAQARAHRS